MVRRRRSAMWNYCVQAVCKVIFAQGFTALACSLLSVCLVVSPGSALREKRENPDNVIIQTRKGQTVILPCNETLPTPPPDTAAFLPYITQWKRIDLGSIYVSFGGAPPFIQPDYNGRVSLVDLKSMKIDDVRPEDEGWYECSIVVLDGDLRNTENGTFVHLIVIGPPRFTQTSDPLVTYEEGDDAKIECIAKGTPTPKLSWYKNGDAVIPDGRISITSNALSFNSVTRDDAGTYICRAESEEGATENEVRFLVTGAPYIFVPPHDTTVTRDDDAIFKCEAEASPSNITQRWYFNDIPVETSRELEGRWEHLPDGGLMIHDVVPGDEGWFTCSPTNGLGQPSQATAFLTVQYPAYVVSMPMRIFVTRGLDTIMTCDVDAKPPVDYIVWFKDGDQIAIRRLPRYNQEDDGSLVITSAELGDSGEYTCEPHNSLGTAGQSTSTALIVRDPPVFVIKPKAIYQMAKGKDINMPCSATGDPTPQIEWKKVNGAIPQYRSTVTRTSLTIRDVTKSDHGIYECRATNEIATIVFSTKLYVEYTSPHPPYNITVVTHITSVHVSWQPAYDGGFAQTYTVKYRPVVSTQEDKGWTSMDGIAEDINYMILNNLEPSTSYEFTVIATNQLGDSLASAPQFATTRELYDIVKPTDETGRTLFPPYLGLIPSPPRNVSLSITNQGLVLAWEAPVHFADLVEKYAVEYRSDGQPWLVLTDRINAKKRRLLLDSLQPNTTYQFRVFAFTPAAFSDPSEVITEKIGDLSMFATKPTGAAFGGPPGLIAGIIAGLCFLLLALVLSILAICLSHRRRKKKRLVFFKANQNSLERKQTYQGYEMTCVTSQTPQKLIHSPTCSGKRTTNNPVRSGLAKLKVKLSPNKSPDPSAQHGLYHVNNNSNHNSPNGKLPSTDRSVSDKLLSQLPGQSASYRVDVDVANSSAHMGREKQFASEEALGLDDLGNVQLHDYHRPEMTYTYAYTNASTDMPTDDNHSETRNPTQDESPHKDGSRGNYVYYHGRMFVPGSSTDDNEDDYDSFENGGMELNESRSKTLPRSGCYSRKTCDVPPQQYATLTLRNKDSTPIKPPRSASSPYQVDNPAMQLFDDSSQSPDLWQQNRPSHGNHVRFSGQPTLNTIPGSPSDVQVSIDSGLESGDNSYRTPQTKNKSPNRSPVRSPSSDSDFLHHDSNVYKNKPHVSPKPKVSPKPHVSTKPNMSSKSSVPQDQSSAQQDEHNIYGNPTNVNNSYTQNTSPYKSPNDQKQRSPVKSPYASVVRSSPDRCIYKESRPDTLYASSTNSSPTRSSQQQSPDRVRLYSNPTHRQSDTADHTYASVQDTKCEAALSPEPGSYKEKLSPVWQKQDTSNTPGMRNKSPLYSTFDRRSAFTTRPTDQGYLSSYSPSSQYQRDSIDHYQGTHQPVYDEDSTTSNESYTNSRTSVASYSDSWESNYQPYLQQTSYQPHVRDLISPSSHYSGASSGYFSHYTISGVSSIDQIINMPNRNEISPTAPSYNSPTHVRKSYNSPTYDHIRQSYSSPTYDHIRQSYNSPTFDHIRQSYLEDSQEESDNSNFTDLEIELESALQRYNDDIPSTQLPTDRTYEDPSEKLATVEARCAELKKEMQEFHRQQSQTFQIQREKSPGRRTLSCV